MKHKKGKKMLNELDDQLEKWRLKLETRECFLEHFLNMGVCHQHYKSTTLKIYRALTKIMKVEKTKMDLLIELLNYVLKVIRVIKNLYICAIFVTLDSDLVK